MSLPLFNRCNRCGKKRIGVIFHKGEVICMRCIDKGVLEYNKPKGITSQHNLQPVKTKDYKIRWRSTK